MNKRLRPPDISAELGLKTVYPLETLAQKASFDAIAAKASEMVAKREARIKADYAANPEKFVCVLWTEGGGLLDLIEIEDLGLASEKQLTAWITAAERYKDPELLASLPLLEEQREKTAEEIRELQRKETERQARLAQKWDEWAAGFAALPSKSQYVEADLREVLAFFRFEHSLVTYNIPEPKDILYLKITPVEKPISFPTSIRQTQDIDSALVVFVSGDKIYATGGEGSYSGPDWDPEKVSWRDLITWEERPAVTTLRNYLAAGYSWPGELTLQFLIETVSKAEEQEVRAEAIGLIALLKEHGRAP